MFLLSGITSRIGMALGAVLIIILLFGAHKCNQIREDNARIKHNNEKRDTYVEKEVERIKRYTEKQKDKSAKALRLKILNNLYVDKNCITNNQNLTKKEIMIKCKRDIPKFSPEERKKAIEESFKELEGLL